MKRKKIETTQSYWKMESVYRLHSTLIKTGHHKNPNSLRCLQRVIVITFTLPNRTLWCLCSVLFSHSPTRPFPLQHPHQIPLSLFSLFTHMHRNNVPFDHFPFPLVLKACVPFKSGPHLHSLILKLGFRSNIYVQNALIKAYSSCGSLGDSTKVFDEMSQRDMVSWSCLVSCFASNGIPREALDVFRRMQVVEESVKPDEVVMLSVISAVSSLGALELGIWVHGFVVRSKLGLSVPLGTALVDMYSRCGSIDRSVKVFDGTPYRNVVTWTTLINGLAVHGRSREALNAFYDMRKSGLKPDHVAFSDTLVACSHGGLVEDGWRVFESMRNEYGIEPKLEHYGCMVDLLGRAGLLLEAFKFVEEMPIKPNSVIWRTLLGACVNHNHLVLAEKANEQINKLDPHHDGDYVLISNAYGGVGKWAERASARDSMKENRIFKEHGWSLIHIDQVVHEFVSGDDSNPQWEEITEFLVSVIDTSKIGGYAPNTSVVLHDIQEEEKEQCLGCHSEKLAVAYVLLYHRDRRTIRVIKNLRICHDCHNFMKHVSAVFDKHIIVRDRNRFHHFCSGSCSCRDFW